MKDEKITYGDNENYSFQSSQIWRIIIPLPKYKFYHRASEPEQMDPYYIERSPLTSRLRAWLINNQANGGTYLITGYRGAGKTSFVSSVLRDLKDRLHMKNWIFRSAILGFTAIASLIVSLFAQSCWAYGITIVCAVFSIICLRVFGSRYRARFNIKYSEYFRNCRKRWREGGAYILKRVIMTPNEEEIMEIKINLGHEVIHERDVLCLLAHSLKDKYEHYVSTWGTYGIRKLSKVVLNFLIAVILFFLFKYIMIIVDNLMNHVSWSYNTNILADYLVDSFDSLKQLFAAKPGNVPKLLEIDVIIFIILYVYSHFVRKKIALFFTKHFKISIGNNLLVIEKLTKLCDRIDASVSSDSSVLHDLTSKYSFSLFGKRHLTYPIASEREIEQELISVLKTIKKSCYSPKIIIVFDELDKADASTTQQDDEMPDVLPEFERSNIDMVGGGSTRKKKKSVLSLIANMKFFLSSSEVYFIFIAGRELYDAWLADITDRDFTIASIFNGIINIDSFLSSSRSSNNVTLLTEHYLCSHILPNKKDWNYKECSVAKAKRMDEYYSLQTYGCYLKCLDEGNTLLSEVQKETIRESKLLLLYRFVTYLAFVSNGSPKKINSLLQQYICSGEYLEANQKRPYNVSKNELSRNEYYLSFGFYEQQKIGFIHYLVSPVMLAIINRSNVYGDKLLVSASFIIGHIFKHFNNGFTWQNLELTPELLDINKTPELREYVSSIIDFLGRTHISPIICGLYTHKFPLRISEEIAYHSKISNEISALFNFSLDESLLVKRYNMRMLNYYSNHTDIDIAKNSYAIASIHHSLGDIYLMEENYTKAIWEFQYAMKIIKGHDSSSLQDIFFLIRTMLKLGLAYEKRHTDNSAYLIYTDIIFMLTKMTEEDAVIYYCYSGSSHKSVFRDLRLILQPLLAQLYSLEKVGTEGITSAYILATKNKFKEFNRWFNSSKQNRSSSTTDEVRNTILAADFYQKMGDILYIKNYQDITEEGDVVREQKETCLHLKFALEKGRRTPCYACHCYAESLNLLMKKMPKEAGGGDRDHSYSFTVHILQLLYNFNAKQRTYLLLSQENYLVSIATALEGRGNALYSCANECDLITTVFLANFFKIIGIYSIEHNDDASERDRRELDIIYAVFKERYDYKNGKETHLEKAVIYYWCAAVFYEKASNLNEAVKCYKQILQLFNSYFTTDEKKAKTVFRSHLDEINNKIVHIALIRQYAHYENSNVYEIQQLKQIYNCEMYENISLNHLSLFPDIEELLYLYYMLRYRCLGLEGQRKISSASFMGPHRLVSTLTVNVQNLYFKVQLNILKIESILAIRIKLFSFDHAEFYKVLLEKFNKLGKIEQEKTEEFLVYFEKLLVDSLFCLTQILEMISPLKNTTLFSNSSIAEFYELLREINGFSEFLYFLYCYTEAKDTEVEIRNKTLYRISRITARPVGELTNIMEKLKGYLSGISRKEKFYKAFNKELKQTNINYVVSSYLGECAIRHYTKAIEQHNEGKTYYETIRNLYFLDDDLHNDTCQFLYAKERYLINCGYIDKRIRYMKRIFDEASLYKSISYLQSTMSDSIEHDNVSSNSTSV